MLRPSTPTLAAPACRHARPPCSARSGCSGCRTWNRTTPPPGPSGSPAASRRPGNSQPSTGSAMRRGEIRLIDLEPARGSEANKRRPAVVVSNDRANASAEALGRGVVTFVPVTSNVTRVLPFQTLLPAELTGLRLDSKAQAEQVRSVSVERIGPL